MTRDGRRPSSSDELVREANEVASGGAAEVDDFTPQSPADSYQIEGLGRPTDLPSVDAVADARPLTAEEIAAELAAVAVENEPSAPLHEPIADARETIESPSAGASSLPDWAVGASAAPKTSVEGQADGSLTQRLKQLSGPSIDAVAPREVPAENRPGDAWQGVPDLPPVTGDRWSTSSDAWESRPKATPKRQIQVPTARTFVSMAVFAILGLVFVVNLLDGREPVEDLAIGDCFTVGDEEEINDVPVVDCAEEHDSELFARVTITGFGGIYPNDDAIFEWLFDECLDEFPGYVGEPYESSNYWIDMFIPTEASWGDGDRIGLCTAIVVDDDLNVQTSTGSAVRTGANA